MVLLIGIPCTDTILFLATILIYRFVRLCSHKIKNKYLLMRFHFFIALSALVLGVVGASNTTSKSTNKSTKKKNKKKDKRDMNGGGGMKMMMMTKGE